MTNVIVPNATIPPAPGTRELANAVIDRLGDLDPSRFELAASGGDG